MCKRTAFSAVDSEAIAPRIFQEFLSWHLHGKRPGVLEHTCRLPTVKPLHLQRCGSACLIAIDECKLFQ